jgi:Putative beta-barrel porin-2, OmpL-like. bbp2
MLRRVLMVVFAVFLAVTPLQPVFAQQPSNPTAQPDTRGFFKRLIDAYIDEFKPAQESNEPEPARRAPPGPLESPPFPSAEYQGYPLIGVPYSPPSMPLMKALEGTALGNWMKDNRLYVYGWITASVNVSTSKNSNSPDSYWLYANNALLDQAIFRVERPVDTVQKSHIDWGFRSTLLYGSDYRYMTAGGWLSEQLFKHNQLYGFDPTEQYVEVYFPQIAEGTVLRVGRWIATPDIETQFAPDNYLGSHSILFTFDTYTQTGFMVSHQLTKQLMFQWGLHAGTDMAPWYKGAIPTGFLGVRWVSEDNSDSLYVVLNSINDAKFQRFRFSGQPFGHDNYNYLVGTWTHRFRPNLVTQTEAYYMWQRDAVVGGTPSIGPVRSFGGGGGIGADLPGLSEAYGVLNYTSLAISKRDYFTLRNEVWRDDRGMRSGFASTYTSHTIGWSHQLSPVLVMRPEIGYFHSYDAKAFDLGRKNYLWQFGMDVIVRF